MALEEVAQIEKGAVQHASIDEQEGDQQPTYATVSIEEGMDCLKLRVGKRCLCFAFMQFGDTIRIEMLDADGKSIFGAINQQVLQYTIKKGH